MKQVTINAFTFNELSEKIKDKVRDKYFQDTFDIDMFVYDCRQRAIENGWTIENDGLVFDLSYCQGDGLSFTGELSTQKIKEIVKEVLGRGKEKTIQFFVDQIIFSINSTSNRGRYPNATNYQVNLTDNYNIDCWVDKYSNIQDALEKIRNIAANDYVNLCNKLKNYGYECYEGTQTDSHINELCELNDYMFLENGTMI